MLEAGKFHLAFFDDRLAMPDIDSATTTRTRSSTASAASRWTRSSVLMAMGMATERLGLGATYSTTYYEPFHVARVFATLDLMTDGRAAWNVVTSLNDGEALNMGRDEVMEHDLRYDRADEFMEVVLGHWGTWDDDALIVDKASGRFADPAKVRRLDHEGQFFSSRGPFTVPRSPQGHPVVIQAGAERPRPSASPARWGEVIFVSLPEHRAPGKQSTRRSRTKSPQLAATRTRCRSAPWLTPVCAATRGRGRRQDGADRHAAAARSTRCRCCPRR